MSITVKHLASELGTDTDTIWSVCGGNMSEHMIGDDELTDVGAGIIRAVFREWGEREVVEDWTESGPTLDSSHARMVGQHGRTIDEGQPMFRWLWPDGTPIEDSRGIWRSCSECGPDGRLLEDPDTDG